MRVSCRKDDAGYLPWRSLADPTRVRVFLDGVRQPEAITADDVEGFVLVFAMDEKGKPKLNEARDAFETERRAGAVRIDVSRAC